MKTSKQKPKLKTNKTQQQPPKQNKQQTKKTQNHSKAAVFLYFP